MGADPRARLIAAAIPPAIELTAAYNESGDDPALYMATMRRVIGETYDDADLSTAMARLLFGLLALSGTLVDLAADAAGDDRAAVLAEVRSIFLDHPGS